MDNRIYLRGDTYYVDLRINGHRARRSLHTGDPEAARRIAPLVVANVLRGREVNVKHAAWDITHAAERPASGMTSAEIGRRIERIRARSTRKGHPCTLDRQGFEMLLARAGGHCEVTGLPFSSDRASHWDKAPYAPSIDRIDNRKPYSLSNCRLVCHAVNVALNEWGEEVLLTIARALTKRVDKGTKMGTLGSDAL